MKDESDPCTDALQHVVGHPFRQSKTPAASLHATSNVDRFVAFMFRGKTQTESLRKVRAPVRPQGKARPLGASHEGAGRFTTRPGRHGRRRGSGRNQYKSSSQQELLDIGQFTDPESPLTWDRRSWLQGFRDAREEAEGRRLPVVGKLPALEGTYFRNGPGLFRAGSVPVNHPYDGDGMVCSIAFRDGEAIFRSRFVETTSHLSQEKDAQTLPGSFGTPSQNVSGLNPFRIIPKNPANTNVILWGNKCLALFEAGQPHSLDPVTLATRGLDSLDGNLRLGSPFTTGVGLLDGIIGQVPRRFWGSSSKPPDELSIGGDAFSAHAKVDGVNNRLVNFSYRLQLGRGGLNTELMFWEFDEEWNLAGKRSVHLPGYAFLHDFAVTSNYFILLQNPVSFDLASFLQGRTSAVHSVGWQPERPLVVHAIPRHGQGRTITAALPAAFSFHIASAFECDPTALVLDAVLYDEMPDFNEWCGPGKRFRDVDPAAMPLSRLFRVEMDLESGSASAKLAAPHSLEFPTAADSWSDRPNRYVFTASARRIGLNVPLQAISRVDMHTGQVQSWSRGPGYYVGEPEYVADAARRAALPPGSSRADEELAGWLICIGLDGPARSSEVVVLDAADVAAGPVATLPLPAVLPHGLHGMWVDKYYGPDDS